MCKKISKYYYLLALFFLMFASSNLIRFLRLSTSSASIEQNTVQYLYENGGVATLMDMATFDQLEVSTDVAGSVIKYFPEGAEVKALLYKNNIIGFDLPKNTPIKVTSAPGGAKGDTATGATKAVELETGIEIQVPLFIKTGDIVKVDTRSGQHLERVK